MRIAAIAGMTCVLGCLHAAPARAATCDSLAKLALMDATITSTQVVAAGRFTPPGDREARGSNPYADLPAFCRVSATLTPSRDSDIKVEVWLPAAGWNGKFQAVGNGGWAGVISYAAMADAVRAGYASASTDTGHVGGRGVFALDHPEKLIDFSWRSEHEMTVKAKALIQSFYGSAPKLSYWNVPGTELGWGVQALGPEPSANIYDQYRYVVFKDPKWDWKTFNFDTDVARGDRPENLIMNATDPDMKKFFSHGGKLLLYHGWSDPNVPTLNTIKYYHRVVDVMGGASKASSSVRLFLEPGMGHCGGGEGPNVFDKVGALERWVEQGKAPDAMIASHRANGKIDRTRPLCPYPEVAKYKGSGSTDDAANFACAAP